MHIWVWAVLQALQYSLQFQRLFGKVNSEALVLFTTLGGRSTGHGDILLSELHGLYQEMGAPAEQWDHMVEQESLDGRTSIRFQELCNGMAPDHMLLPSAFVALHRPPHLHSPAQKSLGQKPQQTCQDPLPQCGILAAQGSLPRTLPPQSGGREQLIDGACGPWNSP